MDAELKAYLDAMRQDLAGQIVQSRAHTEQLHGEALQRAEQLHEKTLDHAEQLHTRARILIEAVQHDVRLLADGVVALNEKLDRVADDHEERIQRLERRMP